jgi:hypothetical protein
VLQQLAPRLERLPPPQRALWDELAATPDAFILHGGTAIALHLGHRHSVDFDLFAFEAVEPQALLDRVVYLDGAAVLEIAPNTLTVGVDRGGLVKVSYFGVPRLGRVRPPLQCSDNKLKVASLFDLGGMKVSVVQVRAESKDYLDIDAILRFGGCDLAQLLAAGRVIYGSAFSPQGALKALTYYGDGDLESVSEDIRARLIDAVRSVDLDKLPNLTEVLRRRPDDPS